MAPTSTAQGGGERAQNAAANGKRGSPDDKSVDEGGEPAKKKTRGGNFSSDESLLISKAYIKVCTDAAIGTDQPADAMWGRIFDEYRRLIQALHKHQMQKQGKVMLKFPDRDVKSIKNHWYQSIQPAINKFRGICLTNEPKSGVNDWDSHYQQMMALYQHQVEGTKLPKKFDRFLPSFEFLKSNPKFWSHMTQGGGGHEPGQSKESKPRPSMGRDATKNAQAASRAAGAVMKTLEAQQAKESSERKQRWEAMEAQLKTVSATVDKAVTGMNAGMGQLASGIENFLQLQTLPLLPDQQSNEIAALLGAAAKSRAQASLLEAQNAEKQARLDQMKLDRELNDEDLIQFFAPTRASTPGATPGGATPVAAPDVDGSEFKAIDPIESVKEWSAQDAIDGPAKHQAVPGISTTSVAMANSAAEDAEKSLHRAFQSNFARDLQNIPAERLRQYKDRAFTSEMKKAAEGATSGSTAANQGTALATLLPAASNPLVVAAGNDAFCKELAEISQPLYEVRFAIKSHLIQYDDSRISRFRRVFRRSFSRLVPDSVGCSPVRRACTSAPRTAWTPTPSTRCRQSAPTSSASPSSPAAGTSGRCSNTATRCSRSRPKRRKPSTILTCQRRDPSRSRSPRRWTLSIHSSSTHCWNKFRARCRERDAA